MHMMDRIQELRSQCQVSHLQILSDINGFNVPDIMSKERYMAQILKRVGVRFYYIFL